MNLPQPTRPRLTPTFRSWARPGDLSRAASAVAWHVLHPAARGRFVESPPPTALRRLYYEAADGWRAPLFCLAPIPGGAGEPVVIVHGLLGGPDLYRYGVDTLARTLREAGFAVYLLTHRGDRHAIAPPGTAAARSADPIAELDLPAALAAVALDSGFPRVHLLGNGFGGLVALAVAGRRHPALASVVALAAPVRASRAPEPSIGATLLEWVPAGWTVPLRLLGRFGAVLVPEGEAAGYELARRCVPARLRGALLYTTDDPSIGLVRTMRGWLDAGGATVHDGAIALCDRLVDAEVPLLVLTGTDDPVCPPEAGEAALAGWGHPDRTAIRAPGSHLDLLLGTDAPERVFAPIALWLQARRQLAWVSDDPQAGAEAPR